MTETIDWPTLVAAEPKLEVLDAPLRTITDGPSTLVVDEARGAPANVHPART